MLDENVHTFMKNEMKAFKKLLSPEYREERQQAEQRMKDAEPDRHERSAKDGALKITLHILRLMNQEELANILEKRMRSQTIAVTQISQQMLSFPFSFPYFLELTHLFTHTCKSKVMEH